VDLFPTSRIMDAGNRFEDAIRQWFEDEFSCVVDIPTKGYRADSCNLVASLDGVIPHEVTVTDWRGKTWELEGPGVIDFKSPTYAPEDPDAKHYMLQMQGQMLCTGYPWAILAQLDRASCNWTISVFEAHEGVQYAIKKAVDEFWEHMANESDYPPIDASEASAIVPGNRRAEAHDLTEGPDDLFSEEDRQKLKSLAEIINQAKTDQANAKEIEEGAKKGIMDIMGGAEKVKLQGFNINWTTTEYKPQPEKVTPAKDGYTTRRFSVKETKA